jgi:DNA-binding GntR family transcriptional regulator
VALARSDVRFRTKQEYVYQTLRSAILQGELSPGQRLVIDEISRQLQVSAIPIREALQLLQAEGLVVSSPHVGATVAPISEDEVHEVFAIMEGLETVGVRAAAARMGADEEARLRALIGEMDEALASARYERWAEGNGRLHRMIGEIARMPLLAEMTDRVLSRWERLRRHYFQGVLVPRLPQAQGEHHLLLDALARRDADEAERVVRAHNRAALASYAEFLRLASTGGPVPPAPLSHSSQ